MGDDDQAPWPSAARRLDRAADGVRTSLLAPFAGAALGRTGLEPIGDVVGTVGADVRKVYPVLCGEGATPLGVDSPRSTVRPIAVEGRRTRLDMRREALRGALDRMLAEAAALGADGVVDVRLTTAAHHDEATWHTFGATGTAVTVRPGTPRPQGTPAGPFAAALDAAGTAAALGAGWWPTGIALAVVGVVRHTDRWARVGTGQVVGTGRTGELEGLSDLLAAVRAEARAALAADAARLGGGHLVLDRSDCRAWRQDPVGHADDVAEATFVATVLHPVTAGAAPAAGVTAVLPLAAPARPSAPSGGPR